MKNYIILLLFITSVVVSAKEAWPTERTSSLTQNLIKYSWASTRFDFPILGVATGDVNADKIYDVVVLGPNRICHFDFENGALNLKSTFEWKGFLRGTRIFTLNVDEDPAEEIIVSAIADGRPSSFVLKWADDRLDIILQKIPWHLRALNWPNNNNKNYKILIGQQSNNSSLFAGPVYQLVLDNKRVKRASRLRIPSGLSIFDFAIISTEGVAIANLINNPVLTIQELAVLEGYEPLKVYKTKNNKYEKIWSSEEKMGGTMHIADVIKREPLGTSNLEGIPIYRGPEVIFVDNTPFIMALKHDIPLKNIIGRNPYIKSGCLTAYKSDPSLIYIKAFETEKIPGFISDFAVYEGSKIILSVESDTSAFYKAKEGLLLIYDISKQ